MIKRRITLYGKSGNLQVSRNRTYIQFKQLFIIILSLEQKTKETSCYISTPNL